MGRIDYETETMIPTGGFFDGAVAFDTTQITSAGNYSNPRPGDPCHPLAEGAHPPAVAFAIQERAVSENLDNDPQGKGYQSDHAFTLEGRAKVQAVAFEALQRKGYNSEHASTQETNPSETLQALLGQVGEKAFAEWRSRILDSLQSPEVLQSALHGRGIRRAACEAGLWLDDGSLPCEKSMSSGAMRDLWEEGPDGCSPQGRGLAQQLARESSAPLPFLPLKSPSRYGVRRLTPKECERLMGFPDDYTAITYRGKPAKDGPRYRALGNSWAVPCVRWIFERIARVDEMMPFVLANSQASREWEEGRRSEERRQEEREEEQRAERRAAEQRQYEQEQQDERYREEEQQAAEARHQEEQENAREQVADKIASELTEKVYDPADLDDDTPYDKYARHDPGTYEGYDPRNPAHHS